MTFTIFEDYIIVKDTKLVTNEEIVDSKETIKDIEVDIKEIMIKDIFEDYIPLQKTQDIVQEQTVQEKVQEQTVQEKVQDQVQEQTVQEQTVQEQTVQEKVQEQTVQEKVQEQTVQEQEEPQRNHYDFDIDINMDELLQIRDEEISLYIIHMINELIH